MAELSCDGRRTAVLLGGGEAPWAGRLPPGLDAFAALPAGADSWWLGLRGSASARDLAHLGAERLFEPATWGLAPRIDPAALVAPALDRCSSGGTQLPIEIWRPAVAAVGGVVWLESDAAAPAWGEFHPLFAGLAAQGVAVARLRPRGADGFGRAARAGAGEDPVAAARADAQAALVRLRESAAAPALPAVLVAEGTLGDALLGTEGAAARRSRPRSPCPPRPAPARSARPAGACSSGCARPAEGRSDAARACYRDPRARMQKLGKYEIVEKIGVGGFGVVFKGYDPFIKRPVAIKTCSVEDTETRERFRREAEIAGNLQHRNIVTVFEFGFENETPFLVQEYLSGEDLDRKIKRNEYIPLADKILWLVQIARGLEFAHTRGIVHRDIKPANIRILDDGSAKILDFGIARVAHQTSHLTQAGMTMGTAAYLAPEQIRGQPVDIRTDVFSFGVLAYELLAYERPFRASEISAIFYKILHETPASLAARVPDLPVELDRVVARCLEKDPARRYSPTAELVRALERLAQRRPGTGTVETSRARPDARATEGPTAPVAARPAPAPRPSLDDLEFHHAETTPRVHSHSMATTALGPARRWPRRLAAGLLLAAGLGFGAFYLERSGRVDPIRMPASSPPAVAPATLPGSAHGRR